MSCSVSFSLFPPSTVRRSILLLPSAFDQPSTLFLSFIQTRVSCLSSFLSPRLFVSLFAFLAVFILHLWFAFFSPRSSSLCHLFLSFFIFHSLQRLYFGYSVARMFSTCSNNSTSSHDAGTEVRRFLPFYLSPFFAIHRDELIYRRCVIR